MFRARHLGFHAVRCPLLRMTLGRGTLCSECDTSTRLISLEPAVVTRDKRISSAHAARRVRGRRERCHERSRCTFVHALVTHAYNHIFLVSRWQVTRCSSLACVLAQCMVRVIWCLRRAPSKHSTCSKSSWTKNPGEDAVTHACCGVSCLERRVKRVRCVRSPTPTPTCRVCERKGGRESEGGQREREYWISLSPRPTRSLRIAARILLKRH